MLHFFEECFHSIEVCSKGRLPICSVSQLSNHSLSQKVTIILSPCAHRCDNVLPFYESICFELVEFCIKINPFQEMVLVVPHATKMLKVNSGDEQMLIRVFLQAMW